MSDQEVFCIWGPFRNGLEHIGSKITKCSQISFLLVGTTKRGCLNLLLRRVNELQYELNAILDLKFPSKLIEANFWPMHAYKAI